MEKFPALVTCVAYDSRFVDHSIDTCATHFVHYEVHVSSIFGEGNKSIKLTTFELLTGMAIPSTGKS